MPSNRQIVIVFIAVTIGAVLFVPFATAIAENSGEQSVQNEEFTADLGEWVDLAHSNLVDSSETVEYNDNGTWTDLTDDQYDIDYGSGEVRIHTDSIDVEDGDELRVSYDHTVTDAMTATVLGIAPLLLAVLILMVLARAVMDRM